MPGDTAAAGACQLEAAQFTFSPPERHYLLNRANGPGDALAGSWGDPLGWAREALAVFVGRGDDRLATRCREVLRRAGTPVPRHGRGDTAVPARLRGYGVTSREMDVLRLVAEGLSDGAIAERLVLSPRTIETHVANLVAKTKVAGRSGLTRLVKSGTATD